MNLKVFYVSFINLLVALAVYSANAQTNTNDKYLEIAKENYISKQYTKGDFYVARYLGNPNSNANKILKEIELSKKSDISASDLSHGDRRKLEVGLALAMDPKVFLFDEPMAGLDESGTNMMINLFKKIKSYSPILLIEHDMDAVFALADRVSVINYGKIVATGTVDEIRKNELVRDVYLGYEI